MTNRDKPVTLEEEQARWDAGYRVGITSWYKSHSYSLYDVIWGAGFSEGLRNQNNPNEVYPLANEIADTNHSDVLA